MKVLLHGDVHGGLYSLKLLLNYGGKTNVMLFRLLLRCLYGMLVLGIHAALLLFKLFKIVMFHFMKIKLVTVV